MGGAGRSAGRRAARVARRSCSSASANASPRRAGRINLGLEGILVMGAMCAYGIVVSDRFALARRVGSRRLRRAARHGARSDLRTAAGQRHRGRHRADAVRHRACVLSRQAADRAVGPDPAGDRLRLVERRTAGARRAEDQRAVPHRRRARADPRLGAHHHALGHDPAHRRRKRRRRACDGLLGQRHPHAGHHARRFPRRHRRLVPVALLSGKLERGPFQRPGHHRGRAGHLRALEPDAVPVGLAVVRRRRRARAGVAVGRRELRATTCSTRRRTSSRC